MEDCLLWKGPHWSRERTPLLEEGVATWDELLIISIPHFPALLVGRG